MLFSYPVVSNPLWPHGLQHTRPPCPSPPPGICPSSCSLHQWYRPAVSSSNTLLSFCPQSFLASGTFPMSNLCASDDQNTGASGLASVLQWIFRVDLLAVQGTFSSLLQHHSLTVSILWHSAFLTVQLSQPYVTTGKTIALTIRTFVYLCVVVVI